MTNNLRDDDVAEVRQLITTLERNLAEREASLAKQAEEKPAGELAIEVSQRRRYIDELKADLDQLLNAPPAEDAFEEDVTWLVAFSPYEEGEPYSDGSSVAANRLDLSGRTATRSSACEKRRARHGQIT